MSLAELTIAEAHKKLLTKEISAVELTQSCIDTIESKDGDINAIVGTNFDAALERAKEIDAVGDFSNPLRGVPFVTKDVFCEKGVKTTACSNILRDKDYIPTHTATTVQRLRDAGAISIAKSNTDEFTMGSSTESSCYGVTKNPHDLTRVAGGSSGGSAAAVAADECIFSIGTDTGGSIRQPAAFCGCVGMRTTYGRTSRYGAMSMASSLDTTGPFAKSVEDLALILSAIAGKDPLDATTGNVPVPDYAAALTGDVKGLKIGLPKEYFGEGLDPEVDAAVRDAAQQLKSQGAELVDVSLPHTKYGVAVYYIICPCEVSSNMARYDGIRYGHTVDSPQNLIDYYFDVRSEGFGDEVKRRIMIGTYALSAGYYDAYYRQAQRVRTLIKKDFDDVFQKVDVLLSPVAPTPAFEIGAHQDDPLALYLEDALVIPQSLAGVPCLSVPFGTSKDGLPIGVQFTGPQWGEEVVLRTGDTLGRQK